jgi:hypothetical protein
MDVILGAIQLPLFALGSPAQRENKVEMEEGASKPKSPQGSKV